MHRGAAVDKVHPVRALENVFRHASVRFLKENTSFEYNLSSGHRDEVLGT